MRHRSPHLAALAAVLLAAVLLAAAPLRAQDFSRFQVKATRITDHVYVLTGAGGNIGLEFGDDGVLLVDDEYAPMVPKIRAAIAQITSQPVRFVIDTHWHPDHTGGNELLARAGAIIVSPDDLRRRLATDQPNEMFGRTFPALPRAGLPVITFSDSITFHVNGDSVLAFHPAPAHTDGDAIVFFRGANVVSMGDILFWHVYPIIDYGSGGSVDGMIAATDRVLAMTNDGTRYIPGHGGPVVGRAEVLAERALLATIRDRVQRLIDEGKTLAEIQATHPTAEYDRDWDGKGVPADRFVSMVYYSLVKHRTAAR